MTQFLTFTLHAPLAAFGAVAVGERRMGFSRPARSALIGLLGAALGIDRADEAAQQALEHGYGVATRSDAPGYAMTDYHTAQVPAAKKGVKFFTRRAEMAAPKLETVLTRREYRTDALHLVALWARVEAPYPLDHLVQALRSPYFVPFVGRKSCPLGLPLGPLLIEATHVANAFAIRVEQASEPERQLRRRLQVKSGEIAVDMDHPDMGHVTRVETRRDAVAHRGRWQFGLRQEAILSTSGVPSHE